MDRRRRRATVLLQYLVVLWVAVTLNFALPRLAPGDPLEYVIGSELQALSPEQRARVRAELGLDGSLAQQYVRYLGDVARGDLGTSLRFSRPVAAVLADRVPWTLLLVGPAVIASFAIAVALGTVAARRRGRRSDLGIVAGALLLDSLPAFWIAMMLLTLFAVRLGWFPSFGSEPLTASTSAWEYGLGVGRRLFLPMTTLIVSSLGHTVLLARAAVIGVLGEDYVAMAEAKGLSGRRIVVHHVLRNALLPLHTHFALSLGSVLGGAVLVEIVFGYPGVGRLVYEAISARDYPLLQGAFLLITVAVIVANAVADATYPALDPRIRAGRTSRP